MKEILKKIKSRKFLTCVAGIVTGLCLIFGADENVVNTVAGSVTTLGSIIMYLLVEGRIDNTAVKDAASQIKETLTDINSIEEEEEVADEYFEEIEEEEIEE